MQFTNPVVFFLLLSCCLGFEDEESQNATSILTVTNGGRWGKWGKRNFCPRGMAKGFSLKVQPKQGTFSDDSSLNGIRLICTDGSVITSTVGRDGTWSDAFFCESGFLTSFSLRVSSKKYLRDSTAANNIKFMCTNRTKLEGNGHAWGKYGSWSESCKEGGICGIQTKVEIPRKLITIDKTGLNDARFFCCI